MKSQRQLILEHLLRGEPITDRIARERYYCTRLADVIWKIRKTMNVNTTLLPFKSRKIRKTMNVNTTLLPFKSPSGARSKFAVYHTGVKLNAAYRLNEEAKQ
jgi:hypothetical protein